MLSARAALPVLLVPVAFGAGLLLAGGDEPQADAEAGSSIERIDVADRAVDVPGVTAVRVPALRAAPKPERPAASSSAGSTSSGATESAAPSTGTVEPTQPTPTPTPSTGGSGSTSTSGTQQSTPKPDSGSTSGSAEEGSTGS